MSVGDMKVVGGRVEVEDGVEVEDVGGLVGGGSVGVRGLAIGSS